MSDIEGIPTTEQIEADKAVAKGYTYYGIDEAVDYINKDIRNEVSENNKFFGKYLPVTVVVTGGKEYAACRGILFRLA